MMYKSEVDRLKKTKADRISYQDFQWLLFEAKHQKGTRLDVVATYGTSNFNVTLFGVEMDSLIFSPDAVTVASIDRPYNMTIPVKGLIYTEDATPDAFGADYGCDMTFSFALDGNLSVSFILHYPPMDD